MPVIESKFLNTLKFVDIKARVVKEKRVAVVKTRLYYGHCNWNSHILGERSSLCDEAISSGSKQDLQIAEIRRSLRLI